METKSKEGTIVSWRKPRDKNEIVGEDWKYAYDNWDLHDYSNLTDVVESKWIGKPCGECSIGWEYFSVPELRVSDKVCVMYKTTVSDEWFVAKNDIGEVMSADPNNADNVILRMNDPVFTCDLSVPAHVLEKI